MAFQQRAEPGGASSSNYKLRQRRSKKACHECHARKVRCDVSLRGVPCSNCIELPAHCAIRRRKNQRADATPPDEASPILQNLASPGNAGHPNGHPQAFNEWRGMASYPPENSKSSQINCVANSVSVGLAHSPVDVTRNPIQDANSWNDCSIVEGEGPLTSSSLGADFDLSTLAEIEDLFASTESALMPSVDHPFALPPLEIQHEQEVHNSASMLPNHILNMEDNGQDRILGLGLPASDRNYLQGEACFELPPAPAFRQLMICYFQSIHPNLPVVSEDTFWTLWNGNRFLLGDSSFLVVQAMVFAAVGLVDEQVVQKIGYQDKRKARTAFYRKVKLLFDFGVERDPICNAQACLLLTYWAPNHNNSRINSFWLMNAIRFARLAKADTFTRIQDPQKATMSKRLWWCVLLRDRILSLGLRRPLQIPSEQDLPSENGVLTADDFKSEVGQSFVHKADVQMQIFNMISTACRLILALSPILRILYTVENLEDRTNQAGESLYQISEDIQHSLRRLRMWHEETIRIFPSPISLGDTPETISIFANMLFLYYDAAIVALYSHTCLLHQVYPSRTALFPLENSQEIIKKAISDTTTRTTELLQVRLVKYLPISAAAFLSLPLLLQAVNICAARGTLDEPVELRKLDVFTKTLRSQQSSFEGADFCKDLLVNIMSYAEEDEQFTAKRAWHEGGEDPSQSVEPSSAHSDDGETSHVKRKLTWEQILHRRPRLFLRLILFLDVALCTGNAPKESDFPSVLRRNALRITGQFLTSMK
ncbi:Cutinase transcription factor 1 beta [Acrodontium crateriforme]|uniref:Cutinase transcription factor 1 beta n=1 Tax=Acrodontium crateriforme TaxID=150365 RepID=A0AAQ3M1M8_9PEZI|nr:Cutinase transcription factor 1 beta [Acrodontium crateriforme]